MIEIAVFVGLLCGPWVMLGVSLIAHIVRRSKGAQSPKRWIAFEVAVVLASAAIWIALAFGPGSGVMNGLAYGISGFTLVGGFLLILAVRSIVAVTLPN